MTRTPNRELVLTVVVLVGWAEPHRELRDSFSIRCASKSGFETTHFCVNQKQGGPDGEPQYKIPHQASVSVIGTVDEKGAH